MEGKNAVNWFEIYVNDLEAAKGFYSKILDVELTDMPTPDESQMSAFPMADNAANASGALVKHPMGNPGSGGTMVYFECKDVSVEAARVEENGGKLIESKMSIGDHGFIAMFEDLDGNTVGLHSQS